VGHNKQTKWRVTY